MNKKGQLTIMLIFVFVVLVAASLYFIINSIVGEEQLAAEYEQVVRYPKEVEPIASYVQGCIKKESAVGLKLMGIQGGYFEVPPEALSTEYGDVGYGYFEGEDRLLTKPEMELALAFYLNDAVAKCANFSTFERQGMQIEARKINTNVEIGTDNVIINIEYPLTVSREDYKKDIKDFREVVNLRLGRMYDLSANIIKKIIDDPDFVDLTYLSSFDFKVDFMPVSETGEAIYVIKDEEVKLSGEPYIFMFAAKYKVNTPPVLLVEDSYKLKDDVEFNLDINAFDIDGDTLTFTDDSPLFEISNDGKISFTPKVTGSFDVKITVEDVTGNKDSKTVRFIVEE